MVRAKPWQEAGAGLRVKEAGSLVQAVAREGCGPAEGQGPHSRRPQNNRTQHPTLMGRAGGLCPSKGHSHVTSSISRDPDKQRPPRSSCLYLWELNKLQEEQGTDAPAEGWTMLVGLAGPKFLEKTTCQERLISGPPRGLMRGKLTTSLLGAA